MANKGKKIAALETLASKHIGDAKSSLIFVVVDGNVVAVFNGREFQDDAEILAQSIDRVGFGNDAPHSNSVCVEDKDGVGWSNPAYDDEEDDD